MKKMYGFIGMSVRVCAFVVVLGFTGCELRGKLLGDEDEQKPKSAVTEVTVNPASPTVARGATQTFNASVDVTGGAGTGVTWTVETGGTASNTAINITSGLLTVASDETLSSIVIRATSDYDNTKYGKATVTVTVPQPTQESDFYNVSTFAETSAGLYRPAGVAIHSDGTIYVADSYNHRIRKITSGGEATTLAEGEGFYYIKGVAVDSDGTVYVADSYYIRKINPSTGEVTNFDAGLFASNGVAVHSDGTVYVADEGAHLIHKIHPSTGAVSILATGFSSPRGVAVDIDGNVYVADHEHHRISKITPGGAVTTLAGGSKGEADGTGTSAKFNYPNGVAVHSDGTVYVSEWGSHRIRKITQTPQGGVVTTIAGSGDVGFGNGSFADGTGTEAKFHEPYGVAVHSDGTIYVGDYKNNRIRKIIYNGP